jgi:serine protease AprX
MTIHAASHSRGAPIPRSRVLILLAIMALAMSGCGGWSCRSHHPAVAKPGMDPYDVVNRATFRGSAVTQRQSSPLPPNAYSRWSWLTRDPRPGPPPPTGKIHPRLLATLGSMPPNQNLTLLVTLRDTVHIPPFPHVGPRRASLFEDSTRVARADSIVSSLRGRRAKTTSDDSALFTSRYGAQILRKYWLTRAFLLQTQRRVVDSLVLLPDVVFIRGGRAGERPPACGPSTPCGARNSISSDLYVQAGLGGGLIGLIDTGVRSQHVLLGRVVGRYDCVNGDEHCERVAGGTPGYDPFEIPAWAGHGTRSAGILTADDALGSDFIGVTEADVQSFKVYAPDANPNYPPEVDPDAAMISFQEAVRRGAGVILAELDSDEAPEGGIAAEAERAFVGGAVVIAANGNTGNAAGSPASARRVVGVGAFSLSSNQPVLGWSGGSTWDGRVKPDLLAPTNTQTANNLGPNSTSPFGATSGAAPYAAGAALLARNLMIGNGVSVDPGQVISYLILSGRTAFPFAPYFGVGNIQLPTNCTVFWGKVALTQGEPVRIPIDTSGLTVTSIEAAIWWPELPSYSAGAGRNNIDLTIENPLGTEVAHSTATNTVFQRATAPMGGTNGTWNLKLYGANVPSEPLDVYWSVAVK